MESFDDYLKAFALLLSTTRKFDGDVTSNFSEEEPPQKSDRPMTPPDRPGTPQQVVIDAAVGSATTFLVARRRLTDVRLTLVLKALGFQPVESTSSFKVVVSDVSTCTP